MKSAECVTPQHPDKLCDRISDAILDACLEQDPMSRVAIETFGCHGVINVGGELTTNAFVDFRKIVEKIVPHYGVQVNIVQQSPEIAQGVDQGGAGDQGCMTGYACDDNDDMIPQELYLARSLCQWIYEAYPHDGKTQVTIDGKGNLVAVVASFQKVRGPVLEGMVKEWSYDIGLREIDDGINFKILCNPAGDWDIGGFEADTGLTGRKLMVDNYGPQIPIGGGCFSGKDATKVDRSAAYMARKCAVVVLKERHAKEVFVKLAYAIGVAEPVMAIAIVDGIEEDISKPLGLLTPQAIIKTLDLRKPQFEKTAQWGHFGNNFTWDK